MKHTLSVVIRAALQGSFGSTISSSTSQLSKLGQTIKQLDSSKKNIGKLQELSRDTLVAKRSWKEAEEQVKSLSSQIAATVSPTKKLQEEFNKSKTAALKAKSAYLKKREALHGLGLQMRQGGRDIGSLIANQRKLSASLTKLKGHYGALNAIMQKREGVLRMRANLRGQLLDAVALGATLSAPLKAAIDFESAMADVRKVVNFDTPDGLQKLGEALKAMSREIPLSASGLHKLQQAADNLG